MGRIVRKNGWEAVRPLEDGKPKIRVAAGMVIRGQVIKQATFHELNNTISGVKIAGFKQKRRVGEKREVELLVAGAQGFHNPYELFALMMKATLDKAAKVCPVKQYPERVGEVRNLEDSAAQLRSIAAIFVKKYRYVSAPVACYYAALRKRELSPEECNEIISHVARLGQEQKDQAMLAWLEVLENGGEDVRGLERDDDREEDSDGEPGSED